MDYGNMGGMDNGGMVGMDYGNMKGMNYGVMIVVFVFDFSYVNMINGKVFFMIEVVFDVKQGKYEKWMVFGEGDMMLYLFYVYGMQFCILIENGNLFVEYCCGWKDIV